jgi:N-methylhydantoinase A
MTKVRTAARPLEIIQAWFGGRPRQTRVYDRSELRYGHTVDGPAIIGEYSATTLVPPDCVCVVDAFGNLVLSFGKKK